MTFAAHAQLVPFKFLENSNIVKIFSWCILHCSVMCHISKNSEKIPLHDDIKHKAGNYLRKNFANTFYFPMLMGYGPMKKKHPV